MRLLKIQRKNLKETKPLIEQSNESIYMKKYIYKNVTGGIICICVVFILILI